MELRSFKEQKEYLKDLISHYEDLIRSKPRNQFVSNFLNFIKDEKFNKTTFNFEVISIEEKIKFELTKEFLDKNGFKTEKDLKDLFSKKDWNRLHLQIIWYGREYCKARDCYGITCKICKSCYPNRKKPIKTKKA